MAAGAAPLLCCPAVLHARPSASRRNAGLVAAALCYQRGWLITGG